MRIRSLIPLFTLVLAVVPLSWRSDGRPQFNTAECQNGTCCPEPESTCIIGEWVRPDKYALLSGGACPVKT